MGQTESFTRWLKESGNFAAFKERRSQLQSTGMGVGESWYAAARKYGWTDNWRPPLESDTEKRVEEEHGDSGEDEDFAPDLTSRGVDLPELPDTTHYHDVEREDSISDEDASAADPEAEKFLEMLASSPDGRHESDVDASTVRQESLQESFVDDLLTRLQRELTRQTEFAAERVLNELRVICDVDEETLQTLIAHDSEHRLLHTRVFLPFVEDAALELLRLYGQSEVAGTIGIDNYMDKSRYVIRRTVSTASGSVNELVNTVQQSLSEAIRASKVLRKYE